MGGGTFVFAGDFRRTLLVIPRGTPADMIESCFKSSPIWNFVQKIYLTTIMRVYLGGGNSRLPKYLYQNDNLTNQQFTDYRIEIDFI